MKELLPVVAVISAGIALCGFAALTQENRALRRAIAGHAVRIADLEAKAEASKQFALLMAEEWVSRTVAQWDRQLEQEQEQREGGAE